MKNKAEELPSGFVLLQEENGRACYAACLIGQFSGWLMWKHPDGQWVSKRKLESWELMQVEDQRDDAVVFDFAPVQPVAVPDGWRAAIEGLMDFAPTNEGTLPGMTRGGNWLRKHDVIEALSNIAAPAAQGDAKELTDDDFKEGEQGWRPSCCDGGSALSNCCDSGCAANRERAAIAAKAAS